MNVLLVVAEEARAIPIRTALKAAGLEVTLVTSLEAARRQLAARPADVCLIDLLLSDGSGLELLEEARASAASPPMILMSDIGTVPVVVQAMRLGAVDFLQRPLDRQALIQALERALAPRTLARPLGEITAMTVPADPAPHLVGASASIRNVKELIRASARSASPVFISGPSGTGKELVAESIHALSPRAAAPFVPVNCGALPEGLAESELFGSEKGAYTGAGAARDGLLQAAQGGTLFLDELGEMPIAAQVKLLRVLQQRAVRKVGGTREEPIDVRVVAATNRAPQAAILEKTLRSDLYYRLAVIKIELQPLCKRIEDIEPLCGVILERLRERYGGGPLRLEPNALAALQGYPWPGNVRELENVLDLVFALDKCGASIRYEDLPEGFDETPGLVADGPAELLTDAGASETAAVSTLRDAELVLIRRAMTEAKGNKALAARMLGISRPYLYRRLLDLSPGEPQEEHS